MLAVNAVAYRVPLLYLVMRRYIVICFSLYGAVVPSSTCLFLDSDFVAVLLGHVVAQKC